MEYYQIPDFTDGVDLLHHPLRGSLSTCLKTKNLVPLAKGILKKRDGYKLYLEVPNPLYWEIEKILTFGFYPDLDNLILVILKLKNGTEPYVLAVKSDKFDWKYANVKIPNIGWWDICMTEQNIGYRSIFTTENGLFQVEKFLDKIYILGLEDGLIRVFGMRLEDPSSPPQLTLAHGTLPEGSYTYKIAAYNGSHLHHKTTLPSPPQTIQVQTLLPPINIHFSNCKGTLPEGQYTYKITALRDEVGESLPSEAQNYDLNAVVSPSIILERLEGQGNIPAETYTYAVSGVIEYENGEAETEYGQTNITVQSGDAVKVKIVATDPSQYTKFRIYCKASYQSSFWLIKEVNYTEWVDTYSNRDYAYKQPSSINDTRGIKITWEIPEQECFGYRVYKLVDGNFKLLETITDKNQNYFFDDGSITPHNITPPNPFNTRTRGVKIEWERIVGSLGYQVYRDDKLLTFTLDNYFIDKGFDTYENSSLPTVNNSEPYIVYLYETPNSLNVPLNAVCIKFFKDRLWVADKKKVYFSDNLVFNRFQPENVIIIPGTDDINCLEVITRNVLTQDVANFLFVGKNSSCYVISFSTTVDYITRISATIGSLGFNSVCNVPQGLVFADRENIYLLDTGLNLITIGDLIYPVLNGTYFERARKMDDYSLKRNRIIYFKGWLRMSFNTVESEDDFIEYWLDMRTNQMGWYGEQTVNMSNYFILGDKLYGCRDNKIYVSKPEEMNYKDDTEDIEVELWTKYYDCGNEYLLKIFKRYGFNFASEKETNIYVEYLIDQGKVWSITPDSFVIPASVVRWDEVTWDNARFYLGESFWTLGKHSFNTKARGFFVGFRIREKSDSGLFLHNGIIGYLPTRRML